MPVWTGMINFPAIPVPSTQTSCLHAFRANFSPRICTLSHVKDPNTSHVSLRRLSPWHCWNFQVETRAKETSRWPYRDEIHRPVRICPSSENNWLCIKSGALLQSNNAPPRSGLMFAFSGFQVAQRWAYLPHGEETGKARFCSQNAQLPITREHDGKAGAEHLGPNECEISVKCLKSQQIGLVFQTYNKTAGQVNNPRWFQGL